MSGDGLFPLLRGSSSLIGGALQVVFDVHGDDPRQKIVHHANTDVFSSCLNAIQSIEFGQQGALVLVYILKGRRKCGKQITYVAHLN